MCSSLGPIWGVHPLWSMKMVAVSVPGHLTALLVVLCGMADVRDHHFNLSHVHAWLYMCMRMYFEYSWLCRFIYGPEFFESTHSYYSSQKYCFANDALVYFWVLEFLFPSESASLEVAIEIAVHCRQGFAVILWHVPQEQRCIWDENQPPGEGSWRWHLGTFECPGIFATPTWSGAILNDTVFDYIIR